MFFFWLVLSRPAGLLPPCILRFAKAGCFTQKSSRVKFCAKHADSNNVYGDAANPGQLREVDNEVDNEEEEEDDFVIPDRTRVMTSAEKKKKKNENPYMVVCQFTGLFVARLLNRYRTVRGPHACCDRHYYYCNYNCHVQTHSPWFYGAHSGCARLYDLLQHAVQYLKMPPCTTRAFLSHTGLEEMEKARAAAKVKNGSTFISHVDTGVADLIAE